MTRLMIPGNSFRMAENRRTALIACSALPRQRCEKAEFARSFTAQTDREMLGEAGNKSRYMPRSPPGRRKTQKKKKCAGETTTLEPQAWVGEEYVCRYDTTSEDRQRLFGEHRGKMCHGKPYQQMVDPWFCRRAGNRRAVLAINFHLN